MKEKTLWSSNYILLLTGNIISRVGNIIYNVALAWWIVSSTGSARYTGFILAASTIPVAFIGPFCGVLSDRWNRKMILVYTDIISGSISLLVSAFAYFNIINAPLLIISSFLLGTCSTLFKPTIKSIVPQLIDKSNLVQGNSIMNSLAETTKVISPAIAGVLLAIPFIGVWGCFAINGVSFIISAIMEMFIKYKKTEEKKEHSNVLTDLKEGFVYVYNQKFLRDILIMVSFVNIFLSSFDTLLSLFVKEVVQGSSNFYSHILTAYSLGGILVAAVFFVLSRKIVVNEKTLLIALALSGISLGLLSVWSNKIFLLGISCVFGLSLGCFNTLFFSHVQNIVEEEYLGRTFSIIFMLAMVITPIAYIIYGYIGDFLIEQAFLYSGIGVILCMMPLIISKYKAVREKRCVESSTKS